MSVNYGLIGGASGRRGRQTHSPLYWRRSDSLSCVTQRWRNSVAILTSYRAKAPPSALRSTLRTRPPQTRCLNPFGRTPPCRLVVCPHNPRDGVAPEIPIGRPNLGNNGCLLDENMGIEQIAQSIVRISGTSVRYGGAAARYGAALRRWGGSKT